MKDEYIRKQDAIDAIHCDIKITGRENAETVCKTIESFTDGIKSLEPADVAPVVHSRWIKTADGAECEKCGREAVYQIIDDHWQYEPFCPHCGAIMDGHREE